MISYGEVSKDPVNISKILSGAVLGFQLLELVPESERAVVKADMLS